jgi:YbbR domain-containing protein
MLSRLRDNIAYKILALVCAIALRWYVSNLQNPTNPAASSRALTVTLMAQNLPDGFVLKDKNVPISVTINGPPDALNRLPDDGVSATVDMSKARLGRNASLVVHATVIAPGVRDLVSVGQVIPSTVSLEVEEQHRRRLTVSVSPIGSAAAGYTVARSETLPTEATVIGGADTVDSVARLVVRPHVAGATGSVEEDGPVVAVDTHGNDLSDVTIVPSSIHTRLTVVESAREREAFVTPAITGTVAPGMEIQSVDVNPPSLSLGGASEALAAAKSITTEPVDVTGATADVVRTVKCVAPPGTTLTRSMPVTVAVHVGPITPGQAQPAPVEGQPPLQGAPPQNTPGTPPAGQPAPPGTTL